MGVEGDVLEGILEEVDRDADRCLGRGGSPEVGYVLRCPCLSCQLVVLA
jgi:hypothetical protein